MISTVLLIILILAFIVLVFKLLIWPHNKQWENLFKAGQVPDNFLSPDGRPQEWSIRMVTGPIPSMDFWPLRHRKRIVDKFCGANIFFDNFLWGYFNCYNRVKDSSKWLDYSNNSGNSKFTNRILDTIRTTPNPDVMIGKFYYKLFGKYRFLGHFTMTRIKNDI